MLGGGRGPRCSSGAYGLVDAIMRWMNLLERLKRWWAPGEYDDERGVSDGEGFALPDGEYAREKAANELIHGRATTGTSPRGPKDP